MNIDKVIEIIREKSTEAEQDQYFTSGKTGLSLFDCVNDQAVYDDEFKVNEETYADALIENMKGTIEAGAEEAERIADEKARWEEQQEEQRRQEKSLRDRLKLLFGKRKAEIEEFPYDHLISQDSPYYIFEDEMKITVYDCQKCENWQVYKEADYEPELKITEASMKWTLEDVDEQCYGCGADAKHMKMSAIYLLEGIEEDDD